MSGATLFEEIFPACRNYRDNTRAKTSVNDAA